MDHLLKYSLQYVYTKTWNFVVQLQNILTFISVYD